MNQFQAAIKSIPQSWQLFLAGLFSFLIYLSLAWFFLYPESIWSPDEGAKLLQLQALRLENGKLTLAIPYAGNYLDPSHQFALAEHPKDLLTISSVDQLLLERLPIFPLISKPLFDRFGSFGLYILPTVSGALVGVLSLMLVEEKDRRVLMWLLICFASPVWIYSMLFWEHTLAAALCLSGILLATIVCQNKPGRLQKILIYFLTAFLFSAAAYFRMESILLAGAFLLSCFILRKENRLWMIILATIMLLMLLPYGFLQGALFEGNPVPFNFRYLFHPLDYLRTAGWGAIPDLLVGPGLDEALDTGWLGGLWAIAAILAIAHSFVEPQTSTTRILKWMSLSLCVLVSGWFLFTITPYRSAHGLLFTTPWAVLGITRIRQLWKRGDWQPRMIMLTALLGLFAYSLVLLVLRGSSPHGGLEWGARFALVFYPLLAIIAGWDMRSLHIIDITIILALFVIGLGFQFRGMETIRSDRQINSSINQTILETPEDHIVTDLWWFLLNTAPVQPSKAIYTVQDFDELNEWIIVANENQVSNFALVSLDRSLPWHTRYLHPEYGLQVSDIIRIGDIWVFRLALQP